MQITIEFVMKSGYTCTHSFEGDGEKLREVADEIRQVGVGVAGKGAVVTSENDPGAIHNAEQIAAIHLSGTEYVPTQDQIGFHITP